ncbi:Heat stress transcription factor B-1 [Striga hermonthica]|uniref:Heat stress transcription factor B-1 n=1 Tax=Striga hermonthica TaxID=68872 RepID=A0A9N7NYR5_STRHE|nr:Heat stress transcription factor B-1 [Striga hermonthica]
MFTIAFNFSSPHATRTTRSTYYNHISVGLYSGNEDISDEAFPGFRHGSKNSTTLRTLILSSNVSIPADTDVSQLRSSLRSDNLPVKIELDTNVKRSVPAPFLTKTYNLVDDRESDDVVSWNDGGTAFVVWKTAEFAKDLLPNYFKHNNFSSFVRQLNTYGFRKTVPEKWEFANENFKRGQKDLLVHIRRRKNIPAVGKTAAAAAADNLASPAISGEELGSSSTSSPDSVPNSKNPNSAETQASAQLADLSGENEKLKKDNQILSSELAQTKRQCDELIAFLTRRVKVAPEQIRRIMNLESDAASAESAAAGIISNFGDDEENESSVRLFGVVVKKKRGCTENNEFSGPQNKEMKMSLEVRVPWMKMSTSPGEGSKWETYPTTVGSLVEATKCRSHMGMEIATSVLLQLCVGCTKYCRSVLHEGAVPPLVGLSQSGTPRAKEKASEETSSSVFQLQPRGFCQIAGVRIRAPLILHPEGYGR